jgi:hypothetical protein
VPGLCGSFDNERVCYLNIYMEDKPVMRRPKSCCHENDIQLTCCTEGCDVIVVQVREVRSENETETQWENTGNIELEHKQNHSTALISNKSPRHSEIRYETVVPFEAIHSCLEFALVLTGAWLARHCTRNLAINIFSDVQVLSSVHGQSSRSW